MKHYHSISKQNDKPISKPRTRILRDIMKSIFISFLFIAAASAVSQSIAPIVGILTNPASNPESCGGPIPPGMTQCFSSSYVQWLEQAALRVVPIPYTANHSTLDSLYASVNAILFTGGSLLLSPEDPYYQTAQYLFDKAVSGNQEGDYMPLWGTCQGFQLLSALAANNVSIIHCTLQGREGVYIPLNMTPMASSSRMLGGAGPHIWEYLTRYPSTGNFHECGVFPSDYTYNPNLTKMFKVLSTNTDTEGTVFTSTMEGYTLPFYSTQWHPEKTQFLMQDDICKEHECISVSQFTANYFAEQVSKSTHTFPSETAAEQALIYNYAPTYQGDGYFVYYF